MTTKSLPAVEFDNVSIVFGETPATALPLMDQGQHRAEIQASTGQILGVHNCSLTVAQGEILVLMGLSGSGKSTLLRAVNGLNPVVRGEVRVKTFTEDPLGLGDYGFLYAADGRKFEILEIRDGKTVAIVRFRGINDRNAAEVLNGTELFVDRDALPDDDLEEDEFYYTDLEGLEVYDAENNHYGAVTAVYDFGAGDLLELKGPGKRPVLIPFSEAAVLEIDLEGGRLLVDPIAAELV